LPVLLCGPESRAPADILGERGSEDWKGERIGEEAE
jgi:hypothetical protein